MKLIFGPSIPVKPPPDTAGDNKNLKHPAFISQSEISSIGTLSFLVLIPGQWSLSTFQQWITGSVFLSEAQ